MKTSICTVALLMWLAPATASATAFSVSWLPGPLAPAADDSFVATFDGTLASDGNTIGGVTNLTLTVNGTTAFDFTQLSATQIQFGDTLSIDGSTIDFDIASTSVNVGVTIFLTPALGFISPPLFSESFSFWGGPVFIGGVFFQDRTFADGTWEVVQVPEPSTALLFGFGLSMLSARSLRGLQPSSSLMSRLT